MKTLFIFFASAMLVATTSQADSKSKKDKAKATTYFSCTVNEPQEGNKTLKVTVKFAVLGLDMFNGKGSLVNYPGLTDEDSGAIMVLPLPKKEGDHYPTMMNLNGQGGDLRIEGSNLRLWGDGDGYQFTDLVIWNADDESEVLEGYVHDYGSTYGNNETFKQFIKCKRSDKVL